MTNPIQRELEWARQLDQSEKLERERRISEERAPETGARTEALRRINEAQSSNAQRIDLSGLRIDRIPSEIADLKRVLTVDLSGTQVKDLAPIAGMKALRSLNLRDTPVADLTPLADLHDLELLSLDGTSVLDITDIKI
ncbi:leucine-rich repeat domain-containing protein [Jannaschia aquimarina]|nr:leucine-rich repeat domain-containing protein [Jannaschia aquimarina]